MVDIPMDDVVQVSIASIVVSISAIMVGKGLEKVFAPMGKVGALLQVAATAVSFVLLKQVISQVLGTATGNLDVAAGVLYTAFALAGLAWLVARVKRVFSGFGGVVGGI